MGKEKLYLGSLLSVVVLGKGKHVTQTKIVETFMKSLDPEYDSKQSDGYNKATKLAGGKTNPSIYIKEALATLSPAQYCEKIDYFTESIIPLIREDKVDQVIAAICLMVKDDESIMEDDTVESISGIKKKDLENGIESVASFLAGIFFYVLKNKDNKHKAGEAKAIAKEYFEKANNIKIPVKLKKNNRFAERRNEIRLLEGDGFSSIGTAILLSVWNDKCLHDRALIERISFKKYNDVLEDLRLQKVISIEYEDEMVRINDSTSLRYEFLEVIEKTQIEKVLNALKDMIITNGVFMGRSVGCIREICDFLAFFGSNILNAKRIDSNSWNNLMYFFIDSIFEKENVIRFMSKYFSVLVEADVDAFLSSIDDKLCNKNSVLNHVIDDEDNSEIIYSLAYALRKAAAPKTTFSYAMSILFLLSKRNKVFFENVVYVLNPMYLQTEATFSSRMGVIKNFFMRDHINAWKCLIALLPENNMVSSKREEYMYSIICFPMFNATNYKKEIGEYVKLACKKMDGTIGQIKDIVPIIPFLPDCMASEIVDTIIKTTKISKETKSIRMWFKEWNR